MNSEVERILGLPVVDEYALEGDLPLATGDVCLTDTQAAALLVAKHVGPPVIRVPVGGGKTLITMLMPTVLGAKRPLLLLPAANLKDFEAGAAFARDNFEVTVLPVPLSYEKLSRGDKELYEVNPDLIICDEADRLLNPKSTRVRALKAYLRRNPKTRMTGLTATWGKDRTVEAGTLVSLFLGDASPYPRDFNTLRSLANIMDDNTYPYFPTWADYGKWAPLFGDEREAEGIRRIFAAREASSPRVVTSTVPSVDVPLTLQPYSLTLCAEAEEAVRRAEADFELPCGEFIDDYLSLERHVTSLRNGFYTQRVDDGRPSEWYTTRRDFLFAVREAGLINREGTETVPRVIRAIRTGKHKALHALYEDYERYRAQWPKLPPTRVVVTDATALQRLVALTREHNALLFYERSATPSLTQDIEAWPVGQQAPRGRRPLLLSRRSYGVGRNLQDWSHAVLTRFPGDPVTCEQLLGRLHRRGQTEPVTFFFNEKDADRLDRCLAGAYSLTQKGRGPYKVCGARVSDTVKQV